ncbi:MAG: alkaline phosphatase family protein [bacterium]
MKNRLLIVQVAALGHDLLQRHIGTSWHGLQFHPADSVFPAVTCTVQGTMRTAQPPSEHGMMFNGIHMRDLRRPSFWEQASSLVRGERIWREFRERGGTVGMAFWQQSLGEEVDTLLSPWPVHKHGGKLVDTTHSVPGELYHALRSRLGRPFRLRDYWGPLSNLRSSKWIAEATAAICRSDDAPDVLFSYLPHLDYALQKHGPDHPRSAQSLNELLGVLAPLVDAAREQGREVVLYGDYAVGAAKQVLQPNLVLRQNGLMAVRKAGGRTYPNTHESRAFAVVDHEVAHVYLRTPQDRDRVADILRQKLDGTANILNGEDIAGETLAHGRCGDLVLTGEPGTWFAYPWWTNPNEAPDYAGHIDIHNKPGFDPAELFFGRTPFRVSTNPQNVRGTHGAAAPGREVAWASTLAPKKLPKNLLELAETMRAWIREAS